MCKNVSAARSEQLSLHVFATGTGESNTLSDDVKAKYGVVATGPVFDEWMAELRSDARAKYGGNVTDNVFPSVGVTGACVLARRGARTIAASEALQGAGAHQRRGWGGCTRG